jgi:hypothetical protein
MEHLEESKKLEAESAEQNKAQSKIEQTNNEFPTA